MSIRLVVVWLLNFTLILSGCNDTTKQQDKQQDKQASEAQAASAFRPPQDAHGRYARIGRLGTRYLEIPGSIILIGGVTYIGDPNDFDFSKEAKAYRKKMRPKKSYDREIEGFGFDMRVTDGEVRDFDQPTYMGYYEDSRKYVPKFEPKPWTQVNVDTQGDRPLNFNSFLEMLLKNGQYKGIKYDYVQKPQLVEGLIHYSANDGIDPSTGKPWDERGWPESDDVFVEKDQEGNVRTVIMCNVARKNIRFCDQWFIKPDMKARITMRYNRHYLPQWRTLEQYATNALNSWVVEKPEEVNKQ